MITVAEQRHIYDQAVVHLNDTAAKVDEAQEALNKATAAHSKAQEFAEEAWKELVEVLKRVDDPDF